MGFFNFFKKATGQKVELTLNKDGWYVVKAYGQFVSATLTNDKEEAERSFQRVVDLVTNGSSDNRVVIKEAFIN